MINKGSTEQMVQMYKVIFSPTTDRPVPKICTSEDNRYVTTLQKWQGNPIQVSMICPCADPEGGGTGGPEPPPPPLSNLSEVGSCVGIWWVGKGVQRLFLSYSYFFSGSLRSPVLYIMYINIWKILIISKFKGLPLLPSYTLLLAFMWCHSHVYFV